MKKLVVVLLLLAMSAGMVFAEDNARRVARQGILAYAGMSTEEYEDFLDDGLEQNLWKYFRLDDDAYPSYLFDAKDNNVTMFDTVTDMVMALGADKIDGMEFILPAGKYFLKQNPQKYVTLLQAQGVDYFLSMGFLKGSKWFEPFNSAIKAMNEDDTILFLTAKYVDYPKAEMKPITFEKYPDAETVKIAITGDMPPIDYIAADGTPAGFNTALLAEIGKRLKVNIELLSINAGARAAALSSGRADGVFWFWYDKQTKQYRDVPQGVALTEPYYTFDTWLYVGKRISK